MSVYKWGIIWISPKTDFPLTNLNSNEVPVDKSPHLSFINYILKFISILRCVKYEKDLHVHVVHIDKVVLKLRFIYC